MNVTCEKCQTVFNVDHNLVRPEGSKVSCFECGHTFEVRCHSSASESSPVFEIVEEGGCPIYERGDEFQLSGSVFLSPRSKPPCLILVRDLMRVMRTHGKDGNAESLFECSGCTGRIRFGHKTALIRKYDNYMDALVDLLVRFPIFEDMDEEEVRDVVSHMRPDTFEKGDLVLRKGDSGKSLFVILSGRVDVLNDDGLVIASMGRGDVFGETSLFSGNPVGATVGASETAAMLRISGDDLGEMLHEFTTLRMNFMRLMVERMNEINSKRGREFGSGLSGKLSEMPPADLFHAMHIGQKTGVLTLKFHRHSAQVSFREGNIVSIRFAGREGEEALFELLKQKGGRFKYTPGLSPEEMKLPDMGNFMGLLIDGLKRIDESERRFLKTVIPF